MWANAIVLVLAIVVTKIIVTVADGGSVSVVEGIIYLLAAIIGVLIGSAIEWIVRKLWRWLCGKL